MSVSRGGDRPNESSSGFEFNDKGLARWLAGLVYHQADLILTETTVTKQKMLNCSRLTVKLMVATCIIWHLMKSHTRSLSISVNLLVLANSDCAAGPLVARNLRQLSANLLLAVKVRKFCAGAVLAVVISRPLPDSLVENVHRVISGLGVREGLVLHHLLNLQPHFFH